MSKKVIIAIDGPSGAGKGTVARALARQLQYRYVDTGAMYRAVAWKALKESIPLDDETAVARVAERARFELADGVHVDGHDVTQEVRTPQIDAAAAAVARLPRVREVLVTKQRAFAGSPGTVMEGRDIGTVVFPEADVKLYLDATPDERARRRATDPAHSSGPKGVADVATALEARDLSDRTRSVSPLMVAPDAVLVDTTGVPIEQVIAHVLEIVRNKLTR